MTGSATIFQVHCSVRSARGRQYGKKYLFRLLLTKTFSCSDVRNVTRLLDAFPSERKANSKVAQNSRAAYRDASGGVPEGTFSKSTTPTFPLLISDPPVGYLVRPPGFEFPDHP